MSRKLKVGQNVRVKETGEIGVIKGREVIPMQDKHIKVQYVIKLGEGIANWKAFDKRILNLLFLIRMSIRRCTPRHIPKMVVI